MILPFATSFIIALFFAGCSMDHQTNSRSPAQAKMESQSASATKDKQSLGNSDRQDEQASVPANVNGIYLDCKVIDKQESTTDHIVGCNVMTNDKKKLNLQTTTKEVDWGYSRDSKRSFDVELISPRKFENKWHGVYAISGNRKSFVAAVDILFIDDRKLNLSNTVKLITEGLSFKRYVRMVLTSIHQHDGISPTVTYEKIEFLLNDTWFQMEIDQERLPPQMVVDKYPIEIQNASLTDMSLFFEIIRGGTPKPVSPASSFSRQPPHNVKGAPLYLIADFGDDEIKVSGIRFNDGEALKAENMPTGSPDVYHFEWSNDGRSWNKIEGSRIDIETNPEVLTEYTIGKY